MQKFYLEALPKEQQEILKMLQPITDNNFVLFGGTAIALQLGHRMSVDFDFFRHSSVDQKEKTKFSKLDFMKNFDILQDEEDTFIVSVNGVKISFFGGIDFVNLCVPIHFQTLKIANLKDLLATKLAVITQRVEYKDYIDIVSIISKGVSLKQGFKRAKIFYKNQIATQEILKTIVYFKGGDLHKLKENEKNILKKAVKDFLQRKDTKSVISLK